MEKEIYIHPILQQLSGHNATYISTIKERRKQGLRELIRDETVDALMKKNPDVYRAVDGAMVRCDCAVDPRKKIHVFKSTTKGFEYMNGYKKLNHKDINFDDNFGECKNTVDGKCEIKVVNNQWQECDKRLGECRMEEYYRDAYFATLAFLEEPSDGPGWEEVEGVREKLVQEIRDTGYSWSIRTEIFPVYENERICSMVAGTSGVMLPVVIDKETGNCVQWMELLTKEEFLSICRTGMEPMYGDVKVAEYLKYLEEGYEHINTEEPVTRAMSGKEPIISCYPDVRGIRVVFLWMNERKTDCRAEMFHIEKGYFVDTQWWGYLYTGRGE